MQRSCSPVAKPDVKKIGRKQRLHRADASRIHEAMKPLLLVTLLSAVSFAAELPAPSELPENSAYPDVLAMRDGTKISTVEDWKTKRAPELRALFQHYMYGANPTTRPVSGKLLREDKAVFGGKATLREFDVDCGLALPVHLLVVFPNKRDKTAACFLGMNFHGNYQLLDKPAIALPRGWVGDKFSDVAPNRASNEGRGKEKEVWALEQSIDRGYAVATFFSGDVVPDDKALGEVALARIRGNDAPRGATDTATIAAWAWGFSRMLDVVKTIPEIDGKRVSTVGHSRNGKTALLAAAMDERFAMAIPSQAGSGGTGPSRVAAPLAAPQANGRPTAETIAVINKSFPHWFCENFKGFVENPAKLPFDQHCLIALCAPRPVLLSNAEGDAWANPEGQFSLIAAAAPAYALFGEAPKFPATRPAISELLNERIGYYIRPGKHSMTTADWAVWLDYADHWLK